MKNRLLAFVFRHGTAISWGFVALAWVPPLCVWTFGDNTWRAFGWLLLCGLLAIVSSEIPRFLSRSEST